MVLHEGNRCLQRFHGFRFMGHYRFLSLALGLNVEVDFGVGAGPKRQSHDETDGYLTHNLVLSLQSILVFLEYFDVIVQETEEAQPYGCGNHEQQVDVAHTAQEDYRYQNGYDKDDTTHSRHAFLLRSERVDRGVALCLRNVSPLHEFDETFTKPCGNDE